VSPRPLTLVTGASGGIGADLARQFAAHGHDLALVARSADRLGKLAADIADHAPARRAPLVIALDLGQPDAGEKLTAALDAAGASVEILVNNAGYGLAGAARDLDRAEQLGMIDLNIRALIDLTLRFLPQIVAARGGVLNVASTAAFQPGPGMAVYYATKAFVLSFSEALAQELKGEGVTVTALCPGPTLTGFQQRAGFDSSMLLTRMTAMSAKDVAAAGYAALMAGERVAIPGLVNKVTAFSAPFTPNAVLLPLVERLQKKRGRGAPDA
jgi:short-subunit dehydrogenase